MGESIYSVLSVLKFSDGSADVMALAMDVTKEAAERTMELMNAISYSGDKEVVESFLTIRLSVDARQLFDGEARDA